MRRLRKTAIVVAISLVLLSFNRGGLDLSPIEMAASPYLFDLLSWEASHLPDKWVHKLGSLFPWNSQSDDEKTGDVLEFFRIGREIQGLPPRPAGSSHSTATAPHSGKEAEGLRDLLDSLRRKQSDMKAGVEETLESEVSAVLVEEGLSYDIGLIFPPVDMTLSNPPMVLVASPRDRIERTSTVLLKADMKVEDMEALEERILREQDLSALVEDISGIATYPTTVRPVSHLRHAAITTSHEWLHNYWFFRPLGWNIFSSPEMNTLNETAATLAGRELGDLVYRAITGEPIEPPNPDPPAIKDKENEKRFDFGREMRKTRLRVDELLGDGKVEEAEAYMEDRRRLFVDNGIYIRKLNQAYFAFHGTYATGPASVSPIGGEVERLRSMTNSIGDFIRTMSGFGSYREFQEYLSGLPDTTKGSPT